jgi:hypothetical protein
LEIARSVKLFSFGMPSYVQAKVWRPTMEGEAKEEVTRKEATTARAYIVP